MIGAKNIVAIIDEDFHVKILLAPSNRLSLTTNGANYGGDDLGFLLGGLEALLDWASSLRGSLDQWRAIPVGPCTQYTSYEGGSSPTLRPA